MCAWIDLTLFIPVKLTKSVSNNKSTLVPFLKKGKKVINWGTFKHDIEILI